MLHGSAFLQREEVVAECFESPGGSGACTTDGSGVALVKIDNDLAVQRHGKIPYAESPGFIDLYEEARWLWESARDTEQLR